MPFSIYNSFPLYTTIVPVHTKRSPDTINIQAASIFTRIRMCLSTYTQSRLSYSQVLGSTQVGYWLGCIHPSNLDGWNCLEYSQPEGAGGLAWVRGDEMVPPAATWRDLIQPLYCQTGARTLVILPKRRSPCLYESVRQDLPARPSV